MGNIVYMRICPIGVEDKRRRLFVVADVGVRVLWEICVWGYKGETPIRCDAVLRCVAQQTLRVVSFMNGVVVVVFIMDNIVKYIGRERN